MAERKVDRVALVQRVNGLKRTATGFLDRFETGGKGDDTGDHGPKPTWHRWLAVVRDLGVRFRTMEPYFVAEMHGDV